MPDKTLLSAFVVVLRWVLTPTEDEGAAFWLYGSNRNLEILVRNPTRYDRAVNRVRFHGWLAKTELVQKPEGTPKLAVTRGWR